MKYLLKILFVFLIFCPPGAYALGPDTMPNIIEPSQIEPCSGPASSLQLSEGDQKRLDLAQKLRLHLKMKGQDPAIVNAIYSVSIQTGVDFELLVLKAIMESDLGRVVETSKSSALGAFQFIEPTWLTLIKRYGEQIGQGHYAQAVTFKGKKPVVKNEMMRSEILALRYDPHVSALIKAHQIREETDVIRSMKRDTVTLADHYIAHMLGLALARDFYDLKNKNSIFAVASISNPQMREAARLNRPFFFDGKTALTAAQSYQRFERRVAREFRTIQSISQIKRISVCS